MKELQALISAAAAFKGKLEGLKRDSKGPEFWYPYDSFRVFPVLTSLLKDGHRDLNVLRGAAPLLDIGCGDGDLSFFFESLGWPVVAIDSANPNYNQTAGFATLHRALNSRVEFHMSDIDEGFFLPGRTFGLALCLGVLYHLKNPFGFLEKLARHSRYCLLSTRVAQVTPKGTSLEGEPLAYLLDPLEANSDPSNFWIFSASGLRRLFERTGWDLCEYTTIGVQKGSSPSCNDRDQRAFCMLRSKRPDPWLNIDLDGGWHPMENDSWRWTERVFSIRLQGPIPGPIPKGDPILRFRFLLPQDILAVTGPVQLKATIEEETLKTATFAVAGEHTYETPLPSSLLGTTDVRIKFELDKCWGPTDVDQRELGLLVAFWDYRQLTPVALTPVAVA
jgi:SAM-dependent methyltransferase